LKAWKPKGPKQDRPYQLRWLMLWLRYCFNMVFLVVTYLPLLVVGIDLVQHYVIKFFIDLRQVCWFPPGIPVSSTDKIDYHDITEILLKVALNTMTFHLYCMFQDLPQWHYQYCVLIYLICQSPYPSIFYVSGSPTLPVLCSNLPHLSISTIKKILTAWKAAA
jgi:hypothetical protein